MHISLIGHERLFDAREIKRFELFTYENKLRELLWISDDSQEWMKECIDWFFDVEWREVVHMSEDEVIEKGMLHERRKHIADLLFHHAV